jgi:hypothetical protein
MSLPSTMLSTPPVWLQISLTSPQSPYVLSSQASPSTLTIDQKITGYLPKDDGLKLALTGADVVVIPAGIPRKCILPNWCIDPFTNGFDDMQASLV